MRLDYNKIYGDKYYYVTDYDPRFFETEEDYNNQFTHDLKQQYIINKLAYKLHKQRYKDGYLQNDYEEELDDAIYFHKNNNIVLVKLMSKYDATIQYIEKYNFKTKVSKFLYKYNK